MQQATLVPSSIDNFEDSIEMTFYNSPNVLSESKNEDSLVDTGSNATSIVTEWQGTELWEMQDIQELFSASSDVSSTLVESPSMSMETSDNEEEKESEDEAVACDVAEVMSLPVKSLNSEQKKIRRRELNRRAAIRSRRKKSDQAKMLSSDVTKLAARNAELRRQLAQLTSAKDQLMAAIKQHFKQCEPKKVPIKTEDDFETGNGACCNTTSTTHHYTSTYHGSV